MQRAPSYGFCALAAAFIFFAPLVASASTIYMETAPGPVSVGDTIVVGVYLDTDAAPANVLDGTVGLSSGTSTFAVSTISLGGSELTLWPQMPALSADGKTIRFTGGLPGGFTGSHVLLFNIVLKAQAPGEETFTPIDTTLYLNDGKGTATPVASRTLTVAVGPAQAGAAPRNEWQATVSGDTTPPEPFTVYAGQDPSVFGGKKYIFFQATDAQSGIEHYEVKEGNAAPVESGNTYVLQDQLHPETITVYAYDKAGNVRTSVYTSQSGGIPVIPVAIGVILLAGIIFWRARMIALVARFFV